MEEVSCICGLWEIVIWLTGFIETTLGFIEVKASYKEPWSN